MNPRLALAVVAVALFNGCGCGGYYCFFRYSDYRGDGRFVDNIGAVPRFGPSRRYLLDLGTVDLSRVSAQTFRARGLPPALFWFVGLDVSPRASAGAAKRLGDGIVRVQISSQDRTIVSGEAPLRRWTREWGVDETNGKAFFFLSGEVVDSRGSPQRVSHGFEPDRRRQYDCSVTVVQPDSQGGNYEVRFVLWGSNYLLSP